MVVAAARLKKPRLSSVCCLGPARISSFLFFAGRPSRNIPSSGVVVGSFLLRDDGWREVSAGERPEVRSARLVGIGEERVRVDAHFDIATIEGVRDARVAQSSYCARDVVTRWRQTEMRVASCEPVLLQRCSLKLAFSLASKERWSFETAGSHWAGGALAAIII